MASRQLHRETFFNTYGPGPWECYLGAECLEHGTLIYFIDRFDVHHVDEDETNNDPANLRPMHPRCHMSLHKRGACQAGCTCGRHSPRNPNYAARGVKISATMKGRPLQHRDGCSCAFCTARRGALTGAANPSKRADVRRKLSEGKRGDRNPSKRPEVRAKISASRRRFEENRRRAASS